MRSLPGLYFILPVLLSASRFNAQTNQAVPHHMNHNNFSVNLNYIYNYCSYTNEISNLYIRSTNYAGPDSAYFEKHKNIGARTFGLSMSYNKRLSKRFSISLGLGISQKKRVTKFTLYEDRNPNKPDLTNIIYEEYALIAPVNMNFYYHRFILSAGQNFCYGMIQKNIHNYQDNSQKIMNDNYGRFRLYSQESVYFQMIPNKGLYIKVSAEQTNEFYQRYGYNNWFMLGGAYYF